jgi:hypothetical protein
VACSPCWQSVEQKTAARFDEANHHLGPGCQPSQAPCEINAAYQALCNRGRSARSSFYMVRSDTLRAGSELLRSVKDGLGFDMAIGCNGIDTTLILLLPVHEPLLSAAWRIGTLSAAASRCNEIDGVRSRTRLHASLQAS